MARRITCWQVLWTEPARNDLREIFYFIRAGNPAAARSLVREIQSTVGRLARFPLSGREVPELPETGFREVIIGNYRAIYRVVDNRVESLAVVHGRRKIDL